MTQAQNILNRFSDDYLASRLREIDGAGSSEVLATYQQTHPDLQNELNEQAASLNLLYGSLENEAQISDTEIANAYARFAQVNVVAKAEATPSLLSKVSSLFSSRATSFRFATTMVVVLLAVFVLKRWSSTPTNPANTPIVSDHENAIAGNDQSSTIQQGTQSNDPNSPLFRGSNENDPAKSDNKLQAQNDAKRLNSLIITRALDAPAKIEVVPMTPGIVLVRWEAVEGALSYIIEVKKANEQDFHPVTQIARTKTRITELASGTSVSIRVTATSGERKGLPSDVKNIVVP